MFHQGFSIKATPLTNLLKEDSSWKWTKKCDHAFEELKKATMEELMLILPYNTKSFEVHIDASGFDIGVLMQEGHPNAFES